MYDVAIIGARCAGSSLALMLAREGLKVLPSTAPRFRPTRCRAISFIPPACRACGGWAFAESLAASALLAGSPMTVDFGPVVLSGASRAGRRRDRRRLRATPYVSTPMLADAAVAAGADLREGVSFIAPHVEDGRMSGIRTVTDAGGDRGHQGAARRRRRRQTLALRPGGAAKPTIRRRPRPVASTPTGTAFDAPGTRLFVRDGLFCRRRADE